MFELKPRWLVRLGWMEGLSFVGLIHVAMPLKYLAGQPQWVKVWGMVHGILFLLYLAGFWAVAARRRWPLGGWIMGSLVSVLPFGAWMVDDYLPRRHHADQHA
ncbi:MAG: DUF3817 domain-containing protein [Candidatus Sericytochromatia bacterium]